jgi:TolB-like protein
MSSVIEGYNYDIFISYRQKDNKYDGWVTEFVDNLKRELEATFKEDISLYFDINPHDGLLETHEVGDSLREKLKCAVFIPIISRTYCDPKSFAWENEFKAFIEMASKDQFGLKVKLAGGNVASRVLPVQIHDLDAEDKKMVENELGGFIRGIEFIYKEPGVNRPLRASEDHPDNNLNKTFYRNQINKVANAIKEIITRLRNPEMGEQIKDAETKLTEDRGKGTKIIIGTLIVLALIIAGLFIIPKLLKPTVQLEKSIAVLPFKLLSDEPDKQYLADGMMDAITLHLSKIKDLRVMSRTSVEQYRGTVKTTRQIGKELDVEYLLEGSFQKYGDNTKLIVQLIKAGEESHVWGNEYNSKWSDVFSLQSEVAQKIARELDAVITPEEKQIIERTPTENLTAYEFYQKGKEEIVKYWINNNDIEALKRAEAFYKKALTVDSSFANVYSGLALIYRFKYRYNITSDHAENYLDSILILSKKARINDNQCAEAYYAIGLYYIESGKYEDALINFDKALKLNPNYWEVYVDRGVMVYANWDYDSVDYLKAFEDINKATSINHGQELPALIRYIGAGLIDYCGLEKGNEYYQRALELDGDTNLYLYQSSGSEWNFGNRRKSLELLHNLYKKDSTNIDVLYNLGFSYSVLGQDKESFKYFKKYTKRIEETGNIQRGALHRIGYAYWQNGYRKEAQHYFEEQVKSYENTIKESRQYKGNAYYDLAGIYAFTGERAKAYQYLKQWASTPVPPFWWIVLVKEDPLFNSIRSEPEFQQIVRDVEAKYQAEHERVRKWLEERGEL